MQWKCLVFLKRSILITLIFSIIAIFSYFRAFLEFGPYNKTCQICIFTYQDQFSTPKLHIQVRISFDKLEGGLCFDSPCINVTKLSVFFNLPQGNLHKKKTILWPFTILGAPPPLFSEFQKYENFQDIFRGVFRIFGIVI